MEVVGKVFEPLGFVGVKLHDFLKHEIDLFVGLNPTNVLHIIALVKHQKQVLLTISHYRQQHFIKVVI
jgi:hypothetical protein